MKLSHRTTGQTQLTMMKLTGMNMKIMTTGMIHILKIGVQLTGMTMTIMTITTMMMTTMMMTTMVMTGMTRPAPMAPGMKQRPMSMTTLLAPVNGLMNNGMTTTTVAMKTIMIMTMRHGLIGGSMLVMSHKIGKLLPMTMFRRIILMSTSIRRTTLNNLRLFLTT